MIGDKSMADRSIIPAPQLLRDAQANISRRVSRLRSTRVVPRLLVLALALWPGCSKKEGGEVAPTVTVQVATAESAKIERKISADAVIYPLRQAALVPKITARLTIFVERGSRVSRR